MVATDEPVPLAAGRVDIVVPGVAVGAGPLRQLGDLRRRLEQSQQIQPTGEPLALVASFAHEHSLDPPVLGWAELQDKTHRRPWARCSHGRILRGRA